MNKLTWTQGEDEDGEYFLAGGFTPRPDLVSMIVYRDRAPYGGHTLEVADGGIVPAPPFRGTWEECKAHAEALARGEHN